MQWTVDASGWEWECSGHSGHRNAVDNVDTGDAVDTVEWAQCMQWMQWMQWTQWLQFMQWMLVDTVGGNRMQWMLDTVDTGMQFECNGHRGCIESECSDAQCSGCS